MAGDRHGFYRAAPNGAAPKHTCVKRLYALFGSAGFVSSSADLRPVSSRRVVPSEGMDVGFSIIIFLQPPDASIRIFLRHPY